MRKNNLIIAFFAALTIVFSGCKEDEQPAIEYSSQGFIKGTFVGETREGESLNETFNLTQYQKDLDSESLYLALPNNLYNFTITRQNYNEGIAATLTFTISSATSTSPSFNEMTFTYRKEIKNKIVLFGMSNEQENSANTVTITDFSFDEPSGRVKGAYKFTGVQNTSSKTATITGTFDVVAKRLEL